MSQAFILRRIAPSNSRVSLVLTVGATTMVSSSTDSTIQIVYSASSVLGAQAASLRPSFAFISQVRHAGRVFDLREPLSVMTERDGSVWTMSVPALGIYAAAEGQDDARAAVEAEFVAIWDHLANEADAALTGDAVALKRTIRAMVKRVQGAPARRHQHSAVPQEEHARP